MKRHVTFMPSGKQITLRHPTNVLLASRQAGVPISQRCGGKAGCLMCKVRIDREFARAVSAPNQNETLKLGPLLESNMRLACQTQVLGEVVVHVPEDPLKALIRAKLEGKTDEWD